MNPIRDDEIEAEARTLLHEAIERSCWYPDLSRKKRQERIEQDVELHWHLMIWNARKQLEQRQTSDA
jgi:hypothetical protein